MENFGGFIVLIVFLSFIGLLGFAAVSEVRESNRMMAQCMADGHKEYECHSMLDDHSSVIPMPIIIPTGR